MNAHPKPSFHNVDEFMKHIGMKDLHHGDMMKEGDKKFAWGFADDIFYKRSLEYLKETYGPKPEKLMAYFKVSMNHTNFPSREEFKTAWPFKEPDEFIEKYLNSVASQDFCLKEFMKGYEDFANNTHLFIMSDTSWPVGINGNRWNEKGANTDNFIIPFAYIPPQNRSDEFSIGSINTGLKYSQTDFVPTVMELLNGETEQNSFAHVLKKKKDNELVASLKSFGMDRGEKDYETCHVLVQPYAGPKVSIVKGRYKYIYEVEEERLTKFNLTTDLLEQNPEIVSEDMSYEEFRNNYYCKRYN